MVASALISPLRPVALSGSVLLMFLFFLSAGLRGHVSMLLVGSNDDPNTVIVAARLGIYPAVALCGAGHGGSAEKRPTAQRALIGLLGVRRINIR